MKNNDDIIIIPPETLKVIFDEDDEMSIEGSLTNPNETKVSREQLAKIKILYISGIKEKYEAIALVKSNIIDMMPNLEELQIEVLQSGRTIPCFDATWQKSIINCSSLKKLKISVALSYKFIYNNNIDLLIQKLEHLEMDDHEYTHNNTVCDIMKRWIILHKTLDGFEGNNVIINWSTLNEYIDLHKQQNVEINLSKYTLNQDALGHLDQLETLNNTIIISARSIVNLEALELLVKLVKRGTIKLKDMTTTPPALISQGDIIRKKFKSHGIDIETLGEKAAKRWYDEEKKFAAHCIGVAFGNTTRQIEKNLAEQYYQLLIQNLYKAINLAGDYIDVEGQINQFIQIYTKIFNGNDLTFDLLISADAIDLLANKIQLGHKLYGPLIEQNLKDADIDHLLKKYHKDNKSEQSEYAQGLHYAQKKIRLYHGQDITIHGSIIDFLLNVDSKTDKIGIIENIITDSYVYSLLHKGDFNKLKKLKLHSINICHDNASQSLIKVIERFPQLKCLDLSDCTFEGDVSGTNNKVMSAWAQKHGNFNGLILNNEGLFFTREALDLWIKHCQVNIVVDFAQHPLTHDALCNLPSTVKEVTSFPFPIFITEIKDSQLLQDSFKVLPDVLENYPWLIVKCEQKVFAKVKQQLSKDDTLVKIIDQIETTCITREAILNHLKSNYQLWNHIHFQKLSAFCENLLPILKLLFPKDINNTIIDIFYELNKPLDGLKQTKSLFEMLTNLVKPEDLIHQVLTELQTADTDNIEKILELLIQNSPNPSKHNAFDIANSTAVAIGLLDNLTALQSEQKKNTTIHKRSYTEMLNLYQTPTNKMPEEQEGGKWEEEKQTSGDLNKQDPDL